VIALPGGFGTFEEVLEILTWNQLGLLAVPVVFCDVDGFYAPAARVPRPSGRRRLPPARPPGWPSARTTSNRALELALAPVPGVRPAQVDRPRPHVTVVRPRRGVAGRAAPVPSGCARRPTGAGWITAARVAVVAGKGGVGSTTVAAAMALAAARRGADVLFVSVDGGPASARSSAARRSPTAPTVLADLSGAGRVRGRTIPASGAFADYLELKKVPRLVRRAASAASLDVIAAATPGLEHLLILGKIKELERAREADLIVVDAPPAGHAAPFLRSPRALVDVVSDGAVREQADEVAAMLADPERSQGVLVTLPEETPVNEVIELDADLRDALGCGWGRSSSTPVGRSAAGSTCARARPPSGRACPCRTPPRLRSPGRSTSGGRASFNSASSSTDSPPRSARRASCSRG
jgi:Mrp family chromosome partitioning ATPase